MTVAKALIEYHRSLLDDKPDSKTALNHKMYALFPASKTDIEVYNGVLCDAYALALPMALKSST